MYTPSKFEVDDKDEMFKFLEANAFGQLISHVENRLFSTHMPFLLSDDRRALLGHIALPNPQHLELEGQEVLVTFQGPHAYISPSWYAGSGVPTWNYQSLHIYGNCAMFNEVDRLKSVLDTLTQKYESAFASPWQPKYDKKMLSAIVGLEITINDIQCAYKLSQNRSAQDQRQVREALNANGFADLASAMSRDNASLDE